MGGRIRMVGRGRDPGVIRPAAAGDSSHPIRIKLLGAVDAIGPDGARLDALLAQPRRLALLAFLMLESAHGACPRDRVLGVFWPEADPARASANLRQALAFLRRVLGSGAIVGVGQHALRVDPQRVRCDIDGGGGRNEGQTAGTLLEGLHLPALGEAWDAWLAQQHRHLAGGPVAEPAAGDPLPADAQARAAYLRGRFHWNRRPRESLKALAALEEAVQRAPGFAPAHAALADVYNTLGSWESGALAPDEAFPKAEAAARRALALDPCCAAAHTSLAYAKAHHAWQWDEAERRFRRAIELDPAYAHAHHWHAHLLMARGQVDAARAAGQRALALQPVDVIINVHMAWHHWLAREPEAAIEQADRTAHLDETDHWPPFFRGLACVMCGQPARAVDDLRQACQLSRGNAVMRAGLGYVYAAGGDRRAARAVLREFTEAAEQQRRYAYEAAVICVALGEPTRALALLEAARAARSGWMAYLAMDPRLDPLRGTPAFGALQASLGLADVGG